MSDTTEMMQKVAEVAPDKYSFIARHAAEAAAGPFNDEIDSELGELLKIAAKWNLPTGRGGPTMLGRFGQAAAGVGATVATGIAFSLAGDMVDAMKRGLTKTRNYKSMLEANPDLKEMPAVEVQKAFSVLHRFNPDFAGEPTVAGAFVRRQAQFAGEGVGDPKMLKELVDSRKSLGDVRKLQTPNQLPWGNKGKEDALDKKIKGLTQTLHEDRTARESAEDAMMGGNMSVRTRAAMGRKF